ncbi:hypothetical protein BDK51DRAFT_48218 [Blyttiomyces helicus]|uniref:Uncharacterized protein n=1 Tax=Blyttiomyces helicus TaxID=388810 RepID=A0A4P9W3I0_9FUNG|nr:hypothetical protein BDK51DRAFT_48218 [Blyttiomyces helicus]|eukprot:RKO85220.1 hypothetical protein BDK51DRAFT_48218 [Blyttiomyces helicus]
MASITGEGYPADELLNSSTALSNAGDCQDAWNPDSPLPGVGHCSEGLRNKRDALESKGDQNQERSCPDCQRTIPRCRISREGGPHLGVKTSDVVEGAGVGLFSEGLNKHDAEAKGNQEVSSRVVGPVVKADPSLGEPSKKQTPSTASSTTSSVRTLLSTAAALPTSSTAPSITIPAATAVSTHLDQAQLPVPGAPTPTTSASAPAQTPAPTTAILPAVPTPASHYYCSSIPAVLHPDNTAPALTASAGNSTPAPTPSAPSRVTRSAVKVDRTLAVSINDATGPKPPEESPKSPGDPLTTPISRQELRRLISTRYAKRLKRQSSTTSPSSWNTSAATFPPTMTRHPERLKKQISSTASSPTSYVVVLASASSPTTVPSTPTTFNGLNIRVIAAAPCGPSPAPAPIPASALTPPANTIAPPVETTTLRRLMRADGKSPTSP